jgi:NAD(P) transhydrogenase subunit alpha
MILFAGKEPESETRIALVPQAVERLTRLGVDVRLERGIGSGLHLTDAAFERAGATMMPDADAARAEADVIVSVNPPPVASVQGMKAGSTLISFLDPFRNPELIAALAAANVNSLCMELIPRSTYAQKMDALSSQASLAGYAAMILAADRIDKVLPMMSTPAGTIAPARVFVIGVGVAGLQAIATARRLGARVEAYDTRPVVEEQVQSLGARFVKLEVGDTGQTEQGYAQELSAAQLERQQLQMTRYCADSDIVITTAQVFGRPAPRIVTASMVAAMRPGSVIIDLAASSGGNVEGTVPGREVMQDGVLIVGLNNYPGLVARDASQMYASNVASLIDHAWNSETESLLLDPADDVLAGCLLTHHGVVRHTGVRDLLESAA